MEPLLVKKKQAAALLDVCPRMIDVWIKTGKLTAVRPGGATKATRIELTEIKRFVRASRCSAA